MNILMMLLFFKPPTTTKLYTLSLHDALPILPPAGRGPAAPSPGGQPRGQAPARTHELGSLPWSPAGSRSEEHTSELQSRQYLVCRLLLEKKRAARQDRLTAQRAR